MSRGHSTNHPHATRPGFRGPSAAPQGLSPCRFGPCLTQAGEECLAPSRECRDGSWLFPFLPGPLPAPPQHPGPSWGASVLSALNHKVL